ncbi:hypothetical protein QF037_009589 [Streptomyces canus]|uniref:hypothetical protein n=1 Tax=Streptomyces canus TaxID=58343 RepID=UPI002785AFD9|nr:hypothetical protein [Streptomyces canus]MDQ0605244.1 hypothetical protein [Streptomyces canus]
MLLGATAKSMASHTCRDRSGCVGRGEHRHDLLVGRMLRQLRCRRRGRPQQRLAGDPDFLGGPAGFVDLCGQLRDLFPHRLGLCGDLAFPIPQPRQHRAERQLPAGHAVRQAEVVSPVS